jgi:hypothetical protein
MKNSNLFAENCQTSPEMAMITFAFKKKSIFSEEIGTNGRKW